jgi:hypothetical protein
MGAKISQLNSVNLADLPADVYESIVSETYTVQRNPKNSDDPVPGTRGAREDEGWIIPREPLQSWKAAHAAFAKDEHVPIWRFNMTNGQDPCDPAFLYGWRKHGTFWPTRLIEWEEREAWFTWLLTQVETLKTPLQKQEE